MPAMNKILFGFIRNGEGPAFIKCKEGFNKRVCHRCYMTRKEWITFRRKVDGKYTIINLAVPCRYCDAIGWDAFRRTMWPNHVPMWRMLHHPLSGRTGVNTAIW